jgi:hypothetical protein
MSNARILAPRARPLKTSQSEHHQLIAPQRSQIVVADTTFEGGPVLAQSGRRPNIRFFESAHWCRGGWQPIAVWAALQALLAGATLAVKSGSKDRANGRAGR